jgi:hypothetical protein
MTEKEDVIVIDYHCESGIQNFRVLAEREAVGFVEVADPSYAAWQD